ncbi:hypothetical protein QN277_011473 [Acacia crassicarpa]|uniref:protein-serine/threonine phosphatase n=1 Tax=Acacia crassicarpa TaxID=499986 RepID=A0AAE1MYU3_9FABA|nr:hypothetical protein QN277_011473 [Acacia crassicarpa]
MTLVTDSPENSSSKDDFIAHLDSVLDASSPDAAPSSKEVENQDDSETNRIKSGKVEGTEETRGSTSHGFVEESLEVTVKDDVCTHPGSFGDMCIRCGQELDGESGKTFGYIHEGLIFSDVEISRLRSTDMKNLLRYKKLYLVLDLDHTLLNSTNLAELNSEEVYLLIQTGSLTDVSKGNLFKLDYMTMMTKLRPFVRTSATNKA